jgi:hypothetical protein
MKARTIMGALLAGAIGLAVTAGPATAAAISTNTWYTFGFGSAGGALGAPLQTGTNPSALALDAGPWTFNLSGPATLFVTDMEQSGDYFSLYDNLVLLGSTDPGTPGAGFCGSDIGCALADGSFGKGIFALGAGSHSLTGIFNGVIGDGDGSLIVQEVPEPLTLSLFGAGLAGAVAMRRRKNKSA